ncbi:receptor-type tyrosine-protein phosphatase epsilon-like [Saccostrea cucullata]|uniref:receptor-type tyrosine-protein phosphatase epsilon-like n=1 Tax=Saccostrea cuccullata TaxID=36930 RepID=UPI002ED5C64D
MQCGNCKNSVKCNQIDGSCPEGCSRGYTNKDCKMKCRSGTYDFECKKNCSTQCFNATCNPINGFCRKVTAFSMKDNKNDNMGAVVGGVSGSLGVCLVAVIVIIILRRQRQKKNNNGCEEKTDRPKRPKKKFLETKFSTIDTTPSSSSGRENDKSKRNIEKPSARHELHVEPDVDDDEKIHAENPYGDFYANETIIRDISINDLESIIVEKRMNDDDGFQREYATLPYGERYKCDAGKRQENLIKNRYKTTFPYDHSIVKLRSTTGSDYINANYIEGAQNEKQYIAAQGPKQNTVADFWTMVWQEHVKIIVILTNLKEGNKTKCTQYWPDANKHINYGIVSVKTVEEKMYAFYNIRKMNVNHKETKTSRVVTQFHYTTWPDHGTPDPLCLVVFLDHVTRIGSYQNSPTLVHCSAGIGRTGTYIAIDVLNEIGSKTGRINVAEYVKKMRKNRMNMVQTYEQYMTIFLALNEIFKSTVKTISIEEFTKKSETMTIDKPANQSVLRKEFQLLMKIRPVYNNDAYKLAREGCGGICRNSLLPLDRYSVHLTSVVPKRGQFINAIAVPSYTNSRTFIVTHYPSLEDAVDFLRLLNDHESDTVICMDPVNKIDSERAWFPNPYSSKTMQPFTVQFQSRSENDVISTTVHILEKNNEEEAHPVTIIEPKVSIKTSGIPLDTSQLRSLVSTTLNIETENPITIVSSDGATLCGVFCAVHNAIQQINMDDNVDIFTSVRQLQVRRPAFCSNLDEYRLAIKAVYDHIQSSGTSIYYNQ